MVATTRASGVTTRKREEVSNVHRVGIFEFSNGDTYEGEFRGNQKHGKDCLYRWKEGSEMRNVEYVENQFHSGNFFEVGDSKLKPMEFSID